MAKNLLLEYKGGGYDGCFWEWNYCYFDENGEFHDVYSSGYHGAPTLEKLRLRICELVQEGLDRNSANAFRPYRIDTPEDWQFLADNTCAYLVRSLAEHLEREFGEEIQAECGCCENDVPLAEIEITGEKGDGGIGIIGTGWVCRDCYAGNSCYECGCFVDPGDDHQEPLDPDGACEHCSRWNFDLDDNDDLCTLLKDYPELAPYVRQWRELDQAISRHRQKVELFEQAFSVDVAENALIAACRQQEDLGEMIKRRFFGEL